MQVVESGITIVIITPISERVTVDVLFKIPIGEKKLKIGVTGNVGSIGLMFKIGATTEIGAGLGTGGALIIEWD